MKKNIIIILFIIKKKKIVSARFFVLRVRFVVETLYYTIYYTYLIHYITYLFLSNVRFVVVFVCGVFGLSSVILYFFYTIRKSWSTFS